MLDKNFPKMLPRRSVVSAEQINWLTDRMNALLRSLAQFGMIDSTGIHIRQPLTTNGNTALYKITAGPATINGLSLYGGIKQKWSGSALANDGGVLYMYFPNNTGELPSGASGGVSGHYHIGTDLGWTIVAGDGIAYPVIISTEHLGQSDFVAAPS